MINEYLEIYHRGYHKNVPENSIAAFKKALYRKLPIELDIRILKDNNIVVFHDKNLFRMTGINKDIEKLTYKEIKDIKLKNSNENIPLLKDVLELINDKVLILIEIKSTKKKIIKKLIKLLKNYNNFMIQTFSIKIFYSLKLSKFNYKVGLIVFGMRKKRTIIKPDFISHSLYGVKKEKVPLIIWTINNKEELEKAKKISNTFIVDYK